MRAMRAWVSALALGSVVSACVWSCGGDVDPGGLSAGGAPADANSGDSDSDGTPADAKKPDSDGDGTPDSDGDGTLADATGDADAEAACQDEQAAMVAFVKASKSCTADADCVFVYSRSDIREHCSGGFYLNKGYDQVTYQALEAAVKSCLGPDSWVCGAYPDPPGCWHGRCVNGGGVLGGYDQCVATMGGESACTLCFCPECGDCSGTPECYPLYTCARAEGCLGKPCGDATDPNFPCAYELAVAGGVSSGDYVRYQFVSQCLANWQCVNACAEP